GDRDAAREQLRQGIAKAPQDARLHWALARLEGDAGRSAEALAAWRQGLKALPDHPDLTRGLVESLLEAGDVAEATAVIARLQKANAPGALVAFLTGRVLMQQGQWSEAVRKLEAARAEDGLGPGWTAQAELELGRCHEQLGEPARQGEAYRRAVA